MTQWNTFLVVCTDHERHAPRLLGDFSVGCRTEDRRTAFTATLTDGGGQNGHEHYAGRSREIAPGVFELPCLHERCRRNPRLRETEVVAAYAAGLVKLDVSKISR